MTSGFKDIRITKIVNDASFAFNIDKQDFFDD